MLLGREHERQALDDLLAAAREGRSGVVALVGEPGIGKTALLEYAAERVEGMRVLRARGIESEAEVPFAGVFELLRPALGLLDRIPEPQAVALSSALALRPGSAQDRFAVGAATLSLLAAYAEEAPLALLVDDAHSLDGSSAEALLFAVRRLVADPIAVILAVREGEPSLLDGADLPVLRLEGLDRQAAAALLAHELEEPVESETAERLYRATAGNPLALLELAAEAPDLVGAPLEAPVAVSTSVARAFLRRAGSLPDRAVRALVLAAASDGGDLDVVGRAASSLGLEVADLAAAESAGLVSLRDGRVEFRHPLARSAIYGEAPAEQRREVHRALAGALPDRDVDRRAWHLAVAAVGPDDAASAALEQAAARARERSAYAVAATAFERAARLAPADERRGRLLYAAADAAWLAGHADRAVSLLDQAREHAHDPGLVLQIEHLRGHVAVRIGPVMEGHAILVAAAERAAADDPDRAVVMLAEAVNACFYAGDAAEMLRTAERIAELAPAEGESAFFGNIAHGMALIMAGEGEAGAALVRRAVEILEASAELRGDPRLLAWAAMGPLWLRESGAGRGLVGRALETARRQSAVGVLPFLLNHVVRDHAAGDSWATAHATYHEAILLARESGQRTELAAALAGLAWLESRQGREEDCRAHAAEGRALCRELGVGLYEIWTTIALGELELGLGRPAAAAEHFEEQNAVLAALGIGDADLSPAAELVDAYLRLGRIDDAAATAESFDAQAKAKGQPWALARAARCRGLLAGDDELDHHFAEALELHEQTPDVFETGRTRLAYGARLRRARQRVRAREELRAAVEIFDRLGAAPWSELARAELAATGETARRRDASTLDELTPQELQIALLLADGRTTREAAAHLFLSPKTVEYHLRHVYRKLGIRSREELAARLA
jgi:DNA-binding CsgD family transcriptional regulator